jgi:AAA15 family ATPase/GTPase
MSNGVRNKINSIQIEKFRKLKDITIKVADRITVIAGHNGIGKSTILGLIANGSELTSHKSYFDKSFRSQFQEIFHLDINTDYNKVNKYSVLLDFDFEQESILKKCTISRHKYKDGDRLKIVPRSVNEQGKIITGKIADVGQDAKLPIPTIYIGMSRVIPIGESSSEHYSLSQSSNIHEDDINYLNTSFKEIIGNEKMGTEKVSKQNLRYSVKRSMGPDFKDYPYQTISLGQDSLSTILTAILSFRKLKRELEAEYKGGILVIDEIDACLHPSAQEKLIKILNTASIQLNLQVIVTTHSLTVIKEVLGKQLATNQNPADQRLYYNVVYIQNTIDPYVMKKPTYIKIKNDMFLRFNHYQDTNQEIKLYFEDEEALFWFEILLNNIGNEINTDGLRLLNINASISCDTLLKLPSKDEYFKSVIIITDGDTKKDHRYKEIMRENNNICALPSEESPEKILHLYLEELIELPSHSYWKDNQEKIHSQLVRDILLKDIFDRLQTADDKKRRDHYKDWFRKYIHYFKDTEIIKYWMNDNPDDVGEFIYQLNISIDFIKARYIKSDY